MKAQYIETLNKLPDFNLFVIREMNIERIPIFLQVLDLLGSRNRYHIVTLFQNPCYCQL